jgi:hypothetical protein
MHKFGRADQPVPSSSSLSYMLRLMMSQRMPMRATCDTAAIQLGADNGAAHDIDRGAYIVAADLFCTPQAFLFFSVTSACSARCRQRCCPTTSTSLFNLGVYDNGAVHDTDLGANIDAADMICTLLAFRFLRSFRRVQFRADNGAAHASTTSTTSTQPTSSTTVPTTALPATPTSVLTSMLLTSSTSVLTTLVTFTTFTRCRHRRSQRHRPQCRQRRCRRHRLQCLHRCRYSSISVHTTLVQFTTFTRCRHRRINIIDLGPDNSAAHDLDLGADIIAANDIVYGSDVGAIHDFDLVADIDAARELDSMPTSSSSTSVPTFYRLRPRSLPNRRSQGHLPQADNDTGHDIDHIAVVRALRSLSSMPTSLR